MNFLRIQNFTLAGVLAYFGFFLMGTVVAPLVPYLVTSGTIAPEQLDLAALVVVCVNAALYSLIVVFFLGWALCLRKKKGLRAVCALGALVNLANLGNLLFLSDNYSLSQTLHLTLFLMSFGVVLAFCSLMIHYHPGKKWFIAFSLLAMFPFESYPLFLGITLVMLFLEQRRGLSPLD